jgi:murein DD-endopeptidase MepM/ murein hydrolase activator NlpD
VTRLRLTLLAAAITLAPAPATPQASGMWYLPPVRGPVLRHFEPPPTPYAAGHRGIDIGAARGSAVVASAAGTVAFAGQVGGELFVSINHADGIRTTYSFLDAVLVRAGQTVSQRQIIARSGAGHAASAQTHLHFGMRVGAAYLDPEPYLVSGFRHDYSDFVRLAPVPSG